MADKECPIRRHDYTAAEFIQAATVDWKPLNEDPSSHKDSFDWEDDDGHPWHGTKTFKEAEDLYRFGWHEGLENVHKITSQINEVVGSRCQKMHMAYDVVGGVPDVGLYLSGDPECMLRRQETEDTSVNYSPNKVLSIVVNGSVSAGIDNKTASMVRGSIACALIDTLERLGHRVELHSAYGQSNYGSGKEEVYVLLKKANEALDLEKVSFGMCHSAMFRRITFAILENIGVGQWSGYGQPCEVRDKGDIYLGALNLGDHSTVDSWAAKAIELLKSVGIELEDK